MNAYDYERQQWVSGADAVMVRKAQLEDELKILRSESGGRYLRFISSRHSGVTLYKAIALAESELAMLSI